jgi:signal transduction histidine kinase
MSSPPSQALPRGDREEVVSRERDEPQPPPGVAEGSREPAAGAIPDFVRAALSDLRARNALVIAWIHVGLRAALAAILGWVAATSASPFYVVGVQINAGFLCAALAVLALIRRRWATPWVIRGLVLLDLASIAIGGWRVTHSLPPGEVAMGIGVLVSLTQLLLLSAALVLPGREVAALGLAASLLTATWCALARLPPPFSLMLLVGVAGSSVVVTWAAQRIVRLAIKESLEAYSARALRTHRDDLDAANHRIRESQAHAERLTQLIVHDLKNPLTVVLTHLSLVHRRIAGMADLEEESEDLRIARQEGARLSDMIGDLLLVSRLEKGELQVRRACVRVQEILESAGRALRVVSDSRRVRLEIDAAPDLVAPLDSDLVRRLIENLVSNAIRHTGAGDRIQIAAWSDAEAVRLAVRNTGQAVSEAVRGRLFERHATDGRGEWHNVGLGLYMCRLVAEAHGGSIALADRPGWNVTFEVALPFQGCPLPRTDAGNHVGLREEDIRTCTLLRQSSGA